MKSSKIPDDYLTNSVSMTEPIKPPNDEPILLGEWRIMPNQNRLVSSSNGKVLKAEPKVMDLLKTFCDHPDQVLSKDDLLAALWPGVIVSDDTLARAVSRLRKILGDTQKPYQYIQTIPKRGYLLQADALVLQGTDVEPQSRLIHKPLIIGFVVFSLMLLFLYLSVYMNNGWNNNSEENELLDRANGFYMRFTPQDNDAAIALYERVLKSEPNNAVAHAGMANALVQQVVRWPKQYPAPAAPSIKQALSSDQLETEEAKTVLSRAQSLAERGLRQSPGNPTAMKALAFVYSAQGKLDDAQSLYEAAIDKNPLEWRSLINLGEIYMIHGQDKQALTQFEAAYHAMQASYSQEPHLVGPWQPELGIVIAQLHESLLDEESAVFWYKEVLDKAPIQPQAKQALERLTQN